ncbi:hypothetical protein AAY85_06710 [Pseudomonas amygdali pv. lachrymans]|nr:hypothetical protein AAY85_06710 [Pseudomonas amygdali pv. lachrymans]
MARCVRAKEPDEVGPETGARGFGYFAPSKSLAEGRKGDLSRPSIHLKPQNRCVTQSVTNCMPTRSAGTIINSLTTIEKKSPATCAGTIIMAWVMLDGVMPYT